MEIQCDDAHVELKTTGISQMHYLILEWPLLVYLIKMQILKPETLEDRAQHSVLTSISIFTQ